MATVRRTARAEADLVEIWLYVGRDNPTAADKLIDLVNFACVRLAEAPKLGAPRPDLAEGLRYWVVGKYLVLYREAVDGIEVVRVVHGARHLWGLL